MRLEDCPFCGDEVFGSINGSVADEVWIEHGPALCCPLSSKVFRCSQRVWNKRFVEVRRIMQVTVYDEAGKEVL